MYYPPSVARRRLGAPPAPHLALLANNDRVSHKSSLFESEQDPRGREGSYRCLSSHMFLPSSRLKSKRRRRPVAWRLVCWRPSSGRRHTRDIISGTRRWRRRAHGLLPPSLDACTICTSYCEEKSSARCLYYLKGRQGREKSIRCEKASRTSLARQVHFLPRAERLKGPRRVAA